MKKKKGLPEVGKFYHFWDDGKISTSRHYICKVEELIPKEDARFVKVKVPEWDDKKNQNVFHEISLYERWQEQVLNHDWLYAEDTDYFIKISCPVYDEYMLYAVRTKDGGWFTIDAESWWQGGVLDVDGSVYERVIEDYLDGEYGWEDNPYFEATEENWEKKR